MNAESSPTLKGPKKIHALEFPAALSPLRLLELVSPESYVCHVILVNCNILGFAQLLTYRESLLA